MESACMRGSEIVAQRFTEEDLIELLDLEHDGVELIEAFPLGIRRRMVAGNIACAARLTQWPDCRAPEASPCSGLWVFPKGIPHPDWFEVRFEAGSARSS
jgi:hypothetical protein